MLNIGEALSFLDLHFVGIRISFGVKAIANLLTRSLSFLLPPFSSAFNRKFLLPPPSATTTLPPSIDSISWPRKDRIKGQIWWLNWWQRNHQIKDRWNYLFLLEENLSCSVSAPNAVHRHVSISLPVPVGVVAVHGARGGVGQPGCGHNANLKWFSKLSQSFGFLVDWKENSPLSPLQLPSQPGRSHWLPESKINQLQGDKKHLNRRRSTDIVGSSAVQAEHPSSRLHSTEHCCGCPCWVGYLSVCVVGLREKTKWKHIFL